MNWHRRRFFYWLRFWGNALAGNLAFKLVSAEFNYYGDLPGKFFYREALDIYEHQRRLGRRYGIYLDSHDRFR